MSSAAAEPVEVFILAENRPLKRPGRIRNRKSEIRVAGAPACFPEVVEQVSTYVD